MKYRTKLVEVEAFEMTEERIVDENLWPTWLRESCFNDGVLEGCWYTSDNVETSSAEFAARYETIDPVAARRTAAVLALGERALAILRKVRSGWGSRRFTNEEYEAFIADDAARTEADRSCLRCNSTGHNTAHCPADPFPVVVDPMMPPTQVDFRQGNRVVGRIVNLADDATRTEADHE